MIAGRVLNIQVDQHMEDVSVLGSSQRQSFAGRTTLRTEMIMISPPDGMPVIGCHGVIAEGTIINVREAKGGKYDATVLRPGGSLVKSASLDEFELLSFIQGALEQEEEQPF